MIKETIKYIDFDGVEREEDFYFNIRKDELLRFEAKRKGGLEKVLHKIMQEQDTAKVYALFEEIIELAYGEKSLDGKYHEKSKKKFKRFKSTEAYSELIFKLIKNEGEYASKFINGCLPSDMQDEMGRALPQDHKSKTD